MAKEKPDSVHGTLDMLILKALQHEPRHGIAIAERIIAAGMSPKEARNVSVRVSLSRPSGLIANSRIVVLDHGFSIPGALINASIQDVHEEQEPAANKKASRGHNVLFKNYFGNRSII